MALKLLRVWQAPPDEPDGAWWLVVEAEATKEDAQGAFALKLWEVGRAGATTVDGVSFP